MISPSLPDTPACYAGVCQGHYIGKSYHFVGTLPLFVEPVSPAAAGGGYPTPPNPCLPVVGGLPPAHDKKRREGTTTDNRYSEALKTLGFLAF